MRDELSDMDYQIWIIRYGLSNVSEMKGAGKGWSCRFWLKACELFVYLNLRFRSYQFEEEVPSSQTFITFHITKYTTIFTNYEG